MKRRYSQWFTLFAAILMLIAAVFYIQYRIRVQANRPAPVKVHAAQHPDVSVVSVRADSYAAKVTGFGVAAPHFELTLTAQVAGRVEALAPAFEPGKRIRKGDRLVGLEDTDYRAEVASAQKDLDDARLSLLEEQRKGEQARTEWAASGLSGEPASELVLRKPQLAAAEAAVANAAAALASARKNLRETSITAPFDALVVERRIAPGSYLQAGTELGILYSIDHIEIAISLSAREWAKLPETSLLGDGRWPVQLADVQSDRVWSGRVLRQAFHLDTSNRQRALILAVDRPLDGDPELLPGTFVKAILTGRTIDLVWKLPSTALSQRGRIWYVTADNTLDCFAATPQFSDGDAIYIRPPSVLTAGQQKVVVHPLNSYLQGMAVNPVAEVADEG